MTAGPNDVWAIDFVHDQLAAGKKLRVFTVVDSFSRYVPMLDPRHSQNFSANHDDCLIHMPYVDGPLLARIL